MNRRRQTILVLALATSLVAATALAQGPRAAQRGAGFEAPRTAAVSQRGFGAAVIGGSHADLAGILGITDADLTAERLAGKTVADVLVEHGLTTASVSAQLATLRDARIDAAVSDGTLDAQRAAVMKSRTQEAVAALLTRELGPRAGSAFGPAGARVAGPGMAGSGMGFATRGSGQALGNGARAGMGAARGAGPGAGIHQPGTGFRFGPPTD